ncbi:MAG: DUF4139 domain-containing protein [Pseudomonadota bacterium]
MLKKLLMIGLLGTPISGTATPFDEKISTIADQSSLAITIYQQDLALIKDSRSVYLDRDHNQLTWHAVSARLQPETAFLRNITHPAGFSIREQNFNPDVLSPQKLLEKHVQKPVTIIRTNPANGQETSETAMVVTAQGGVILKFPDRIETGIPGRLVFPAIPDGLYDKPVLTAALINPVAGKQGLVLTYLSTGLSWQADYIVELGERDDQINLTGLATLTNRSGATYSNARLQLVAGDLNRINRPRAASPAMLKMVAESASDDGMQTDALFEYHRYTLQRPATLFDNQTKQVTFMSATRVPVHRIYLLQGENHYYTGQYNQAGSPQKVNVLISFQNEGDGLGVPLPKGIMRVYKTDSHADTQYVGEDYIDHTPARAVIRLRLGHAFDLMAEKKQTDFKKLDTTPHNRHFETAYQITLKNTKKEAVTLTIHEPIPGDWTILSESAPHQKLAANLVEWKVNVPADSETTVTYRVRVNL